MASVDLTRGAIAMISEGGAEGMKPVLQVSDVRLVNTTQSTMERYWMMLSDGVHTQQAMLATQMNPIIKNGTLQKGSVVQLNEFICNTIQGRRIIIFINLEVLVPKSDIIGVPTTFDSGASASQNRAPMPAQSTSMNQPGMAAGNPQPCGGSCSGGLAAGQNLLGGASMSPKPDHVANTSSYGSS